MHHCLGLRKYFLNRRRVLYWRGYSIWWLGAHILSKHFNGSLNLPQTCLDLSPLLFFYFTSMTKLETFEFPIIYWLKPINFQMSTVQSISSPSCGMGLFPYKWQVRRRRTAKLDPTLVHTHVHVLDIKMACLAISFLELFYHPGSAYVSIHRYK